MESYLDRIKLMKNEKKMTNDKLSEITGIPLGTLSKIMAGISDSPKLSNIVAIAEALGGGFGAAGTAATIATAVTGAISAVGVGIYSLE